MSCFDAGNTVGRWCNEKDATLVVENIGKRFGETQVLRLPLLAKPLQFLSLAKIGAGEQQSPAHRGTNRSV
uniref:Uncharacterized protein n=1 Tax=Candidatus Kentrum sp. DK TaxID=2126562 RepID=A0A450TAJ6_9GAMM|nr:MAG: hypothetical protein BECKDK2373C_GA0170839_11111 [Candidatus Kentron sp. DK]